MKKTLLLLLIFFTLGCSTSQNYNSKSSETLFKECKLEGTLSKELFAKALHGYNQLQKSGKIKKSATLSIIDFSKASTEKRLYVISLKDKKLLYNTYVSHGKNSGDNYAKKFSNKEGSLQSSLGFYRTLSTYYGKHGYSLKLKGLEKDINHNAESRAIVIHGADYVSSSFIKQYGRLGRSWGCPALPQNLKKEIIDTIKGGSCLFIYARNTQYQKSSKLFE